MPNVKVGSIIEYKYTITSPFISSFPKWNFQKEIPIVYSEYKTEIPDYFQYNIHRTGTLLPKEVPNSVGRTITLNDRPFVRQAVSDVESKTLNYNETQMTFSMENVEAIKEEPFTNNITNYIPSVVYELSSRKLPNTPIKYFSESWEDVVKNIYNSDYFGAELEKSSYFEDELKQVVSGEMNAEQKIAAIFNFVKTRMNKNQFIGMYCNDGVKKHSKSKLEM